jgi:hypothetical protein
MTPKEKAEELFNKMYNVDDIKTYYSICKHKAKLCALIAVDEMLDFRNRLYINENSLAHQYLLEVKDELNKL